MKITIKVNGNLKGIIDKLNKMKKDLPAMKKELFEQCCEKIKELANKNLAGWDIGNNVKAEIETSWTYVVTENGALLTNSAKKAVFVEFGTGVVGEENSHPNAIAENYEYNKERYVEDRKGRLFRTKDEQGRWTFYQNLQDLDLPTEYSDDRIYFNEPNKNSERMLIRTSGAPASLFAFNAIIQFAEGEYAKKIWEDIKIKYWG